MVSGSLVSLHVTDFRFTVSVSLSLVSEELEAFSDFSIPESFVLNLAFSLASADSEELDVSCSNFLCFVSVLSFASLESDNFGFSTTISLLVAFTLPLTALCSSLES